MDVIEKIIRDAVDQQDELLTKNRISIEKNCFTLEGTASRNAKDTDDPESPPQ